MAMMTSTATSVTPDKRGGHRCLCHGTFLGMQRTSGWIRPIEAVNHEAAAWNQGDVYVSEKDIPLGVKLEEGDSVVFYLYADAKGLGAESCVQVWHDQAQAMKAAVTAKGVSFASALVAMTTLLAAQAPAPVTNAQSSPLPAPPCAVDLSCFYDDDDTDDEDDSDTDFVDVAAGSAKPTTISLADILLAPTQPQECPSVGSSLHSAGGCKPCSFFPKGTCTNGGDCEFCHYAHEKKPRPKNKTKRARERQKGRMGGAAEAKPQMIKLAPQEMPMKCEVSPFLMTLTKDIFQQSKEGLQSPTTCSNIDEGSDDGNSESSSWGSPSPVERDVSLSPPPGLEQERPFSPPPGLVPPPPDFPPPPMLKYSLVGSD